MVHGGMYCGFAGFKGDGMSQQMHHDNAALAIWREECAVIE